MQILDACCKLRGPVKANPFSRSRDTGCNKDVYGDPRELYTERLSCSASKSTISLFDASSQGPATPISSARASSTTTEPDIDSI